jgi:hypothetical protein
MFFTKLKYKIKSYTDANKKILKLILKKDYIIKNSAFLTDEPNKENRLTNYKYEPILLDTISEPSNLANKFINNINLNISNQENKNVWIYLNNAVIQFPIKKIRIFNDDKIIIKCEMDDKDLCTILPKDLYNDKFININNDQYGWLTLDAVTTITSYYFKKDSIYPYTTSYGDVFNVSYTATWRLAGLVDPISFKIGKISYATYAKALKCLYSDSTTGDVILQIFGDVNNNPDISYSWGYGTGQYLNLFFYFSIDDFNQNTSLYNNNNQLYYAKTINNLNLIYKKNTTSQYGFYQAALGGTNYNAYTVSPTYANLGGNKSTNQYVMNSRNIFDYGLTFGTAWAGSSLPKTNIINMNTTLSAGITDTTETLSFKKVDVAITLPCIPKGEGYN